MKYYLKFLSLSLIPIGIIFAQIPDSKSNHQKIEAFRVSNPITIDGILSEQDWQRPGITNFTQKEPCEGTEPSERTEVWLAYDDQALYIAVRLYDSAPDSIISRMGRRDADISADWFYIGIDSYHDRRSGFFFGVYASGAITDGTLNNDDWSDNSWDGVWEAKTNIDGKGWTAEIRIPYSQLRFAKQEEYVWGINFARKIERKNEEDYFIMVPKKESGWVSRFADLTGIHNINPPARFEILPYLLSSNKRTNQFRVGDPFKKGNVYDAEIGIDSKIGLGTNLVLNTTVNPDFGQVEVDPAVVNLSQYETYFQEKRPFFVEGADFLSFGYGGANNNWSFNFSTPDLFYSRRIGKPPEGSIQHQQSPDLFQDIPDRTHILGAAKLTGKISDGWSLGAVQAFTAREYAQIDSAGIRFADIVEPFTYHGLVRTLREFNNGRQAVGLIGTAVIRDLNRDYLVEQFASQSYALGIDGWANLDENQVWVITGWLAGSRIQGSPQKILGLQESSAHYFQRPDAFYLNLNPVATSLAGYAGRIAVNKQSGNYQFNSAIGLLSPGFDPNDLGYMSRADIINGHVVAGYAWFEPDQVFRRKSFNVGTFRSYNFGGNKTGEGYCFFTNLQFLNYWSFYGNYNFSPPVFDPYRTRGGPIMKTTQINSTNLGFSSDSRKSVTCNLEMYGSKNESGSYTVQILPSVGIKPSSGITLSFGPSISQILNTAQWVDEKSDINSANTYGARYIFAKIKQNELSANIRLDWTFTPKISLQLFLQPLISIGSYSDFKELKQPGTYTFNFYGKDNGSTIYKADREFRIGPYGDGTSDSIIVYPGDYVVMPDGGQPQRQFKIENPDFNLKSLRGNAVLRWEYLPGSTLYLVWTRSSINENRPGYFNLGRDFRDLITASDHADVIMIKITWWWNP